MLLVVTLSMWKNHRVWVKQPLRHPTARPFLQQCSSIVFSQVAFPMKQEFGAGLHLCQSKEPVCSKSALRMSQSLVQSLVPVPKSSVDRSASSGNVPLAFPFGSSSNQRRRHQMWIPTRTWEMTLAVPQCQQILSSASRSSLFRFARLSQM